MDPKADGVEILSRAQCLEFLRSRRLGRIALSMDALPVVLPILYVVVGESIIFRTGEGSKFDAAVRDAVVAFEVDDADIDLAEGWSVLVTGRARRVEDPELIALTSSLQPWLPVEPQRFVAISVDLVSGRRMALHPDVLGAVAAAS